MLTQLSRSLGSLRLVEGPVDGAADLEVTLHEQALAWRLVSALVEHDMPPVFALALLDAWPDLPSAS